MQGKAELGCPCCVYRGCNAAAPVSCTVFGMLTLFVLLDNRLILFLQQSSVEWASSLWMHVVQELDPQYQRTVGLGQGLLLLSHRNKSHHMWPCSLKQLRHSCSVWCHWHRHNPDVGCGDLLQVIVASKFDNRLKEFGERWEVDKYLSATGYLPANVKPFFIALPKVPIWWKSS